MKKYFEFMAKYYLDGDKDFELQFLRLHNHAIADPRAQGVRDSVICANVLKQATSLKNVPLDLLLPGIVVNTTPDDYRVNKQLQMMKFNGERWEMFGPILEDAGPAG